MIEAVLVVFTKAVAGRDDELNDWYTNIHIRDALRFRGSIAVQRFALSHSQVEPIAPDFAWRYLALYDVFDARRFSQEHWENAQTSRMQVTDAFDDTVLDDYHYYPMLFRNKFPGLSSEGGVIVEQLNAAPGDEAAFVAAYSDGHFAAALARPSVRSGALLAYREQGQMLPTHPVHRFVAVYCVDDFADLATWPRLGEPGSMVEPGSVRTTCWDPLTARINKDQVLHPDSAALAAEEQARARMGTGILTGGREKLSSI